MHCMSSFPFFRFWIDNYPIHFDLDVRLKTVINNFRSIAHSEGNEACKQLLDLSKVYV